MAATTDERIALLRKQQEELVKRGQAYQADPYQRGNVKAAQAAGIQKEYQRLEYEIQTLGAQKQVEEKRITEEQAQEALARSAQNIKASQSKGAPTRKDFETSVDAKPGTLSGRNVQTGETAQQQAERRRQERNRVVYGAPSEAENLRISQELRARGISDSSTPTAQEIYEAKRRGVKSSRLSDSVQSTEYAVKREQRQEYKQLQSERARTGATFSSLKGSVTPQEGQQFRNIYKQKQQIAQDELRTNRLRLGESDLLDANTSDSIQTPQTTSQKAKLALSGAGKFFKDLVRPLGKSLSLAGTYQYYPLDSTQEVQQGLLEDPETALGTIQLATLPLLPYALEYQAAKITIEGLGLYQILSGSKTAYQGYLTSDYESVGYGGASAAFGYFTTEFAQTKTFKNRLTGTYRPEVLEQTPFPIEPRPITLEKALAKDQLNVQVITGKTARGALYASDVTDVRGGTSGTPVYFGVPASTVIKTESGNITVFRYGRFAINPKRNPTYLPNVVKGIIRGKKPISALKDATLYSPEVVISDLTVDLPKKPTPQEAPAFYADLLAKSEKAQEPILTVSPKTVTDYPQPEQELIAISTQETSQAQRRVRIGTTRTGVKVFKQLPPREFKGKLPYGGDIARSFAERAGVKILSRLESYKIQAREADIIAVDVAQRGLTKYRLIEKGDPLARQIDNSGRHHTTLIKKIGRELSEKYNVPINKKKLDVFADVHDINKERVTNVNVASAISRGLRKGLYDEVKNVKDLTPSQISDVARAIELDERPPVNIGNIVKRTSETVSNALYTLTEEQKVFINADRLARFGKNADPDMIYPLTSQAGKTKTVDVNELKNLGGFTLPEARAPKTPRGRYYAVYNRGGGLPNYPTSQGNRDILDSYSKPSPRAITVLRQGATPQLRLSLIPRQTLRLVQRETIRPTQTRAPYTPPRTTPYTPSTPYSPPITPRPTPRPPPSIPSRPTSRPPYTPIRTIRPPTERIDYRYLRREEKKPKLFKQQSLMQPRKYTPTLYAIFKQETTSKKDSIRKRRLTGLEDRPILV